MDRATEPAARRQDPESTPERLSAPSQVQVLRRLASATGNRGFTSVARTLARYTETGTGTWNAPLGFGATSSAGKARDALDAIWSEATRLADAGFEDFDEFISEADYWWYQLAGDPARSLTAEEAGWLESFGEYFSSVHRDAIRLLSYTVREQVRPWKQPPISWDEVYAIRETVHMLFMNQPDSDEILQLTELLGKVEELAKEFGTWTERAADAEELVSKAKDFAQIHAGVKKLLGKVEEMKKTLELMHTIGEMTGLVGEGDDLTRFGAALDVMDVVIGKSGVPVLSQLWDGYILAGAKSALAGIRRIRDLAREHQRPHVIEYFAERRGNPFPPNIDNVIFPTGIDKDWNLPGGVETLQFMWQLMRNDSFVDRAPLDVVPTALEDLLLEHRDLFNTGATGTLRVDSDWNPWTRDTSPNVKPWLKKNKHRVWTMLYGAIPKPKKATKLIPD